MIYQNIGITGHQSIPREAMPLIREGIADLITEFNSNIVCISSLAVGADQLFAKQILDAGGKLHAVIPCERYEETFSDDRNLIEFRNLVSMANEIEVLKYKKPSEKAFLEAGKRVVDLSDIIVAIWDGEKAKGIGGTADIVNYARNSQKRIVILWPEGVTR